MSVVVCDSHAKNRDIIIPLKHQMYFNMNEFHCCYDSFQYPILFAFGNESYNMYMSYLNSKNN